MNVFQEKDVGSVTEDFDKPENQNNEGKKDHWSNEVSNAKTNNAICIELLSVLFLNSILLCLES